MPFFKIDDRKVKQYIKNIVGSKEGDFNGQAMNMGTTINPVVDIKPDMSVKSVKDLTNSGGIWTPANGKSVRLFGGVITVSKEAACAGAEYLNLAATETIVYVQLSNAALVATGNVVVIPFTIPGNGYLCPKNTALTLYFNGALTAGAVACSVWGWEE